MKKLISAAAVILLMSIFLLFQVSCSGTAPTVPAPLVNTPTATPTGIFTPLPTATSTPATAKDWIDFDEGSWLGWTSSGANGSLVSATVQNAWAPTVTVSTNYPQSGTQSLLVQTVTSAMTNSYLQVTINGPSLSNVQFSGSNPTYLSLWLNPVNTQIELTTVSLGLGSSPTNYTATVNASLTNDGNWVNILVPISSFNSPSAIPAMTDLNDIVITLTNPTCECSLNCYVDSIDFYQ